MFKVVVLLDCDECGHSLCKAAVCSSEHLPCENAVRLLIGSAEARGWRFMRDYGICPECIQEEIKMADWLQEPEDEYRI
jgi:hypothetical protein